MRKLTKLTLTAMSFICVIGCLLPLTKVLADRYDPLEVAYETQVTLSAGRECIVKLNKKDLAGRKVVSVESNNIESGYAYVDQNSDGRTFVIEGKKAGAITYTITLKAKKKSTITKKMVVTYLKYENPLGTAKIGSTNLKKDFESGSDVVMSKKKKKAKIDLRARSGWEILSISCKSWKNGKEKIKKVKNQAQFTYPTCDDYSVITIKVKNKKSGFAESLRVYVYYY
ncbi:MAG: hypothetical protein IJ801_06665 [Lachnospiraceae bacterium]|nr:hypothetical protein [Lachnospiraceae bacterium]